MANQSDSKSSRKELITLPKKKREKNKKKNL